MALITPEDKNTTTYIGQHRELAAATTTPVDRTAVEIKADSAGAINVLDLLGQANFLELAFYRASGDVANANVEVWAGNSQDNESFLCCCKATVTPGTAIRGDGKWCDSITITAQTSTADIRINGIADDIAKLSIDIKGLDCVYLVISQATYKCVARIY